MNVIQALLCGFALLITSAALTQDWGIKAGAGVSTISSLTVKEIWQDDLNPKYWDWFKMPELKESWSIGAFYKFNLSKIILQTGLNYSIKGERTKSNNSDWIIIETENEGCEGSIPLSDFTVYEIRYKQSLHYIEIPLTVKFGNFPLFLGGQIAYRPFYMYKSKYYYAKREIDGSVTRDEEVTTAMGNKYTNWKKLDYGALFGLEFPIKERFLVEAVYYLGLASLTDSKWYRKNYNNQLLLQLRYKLNSNKEKSANEDTGEQ